MPHDWEVLHHANAAIPASPPTPSADPDARKCVRSDRGNLADGTPCIIVRVWRTTADRPQEGEPTFHIVPAQNYNGFDDFYARCAT